MPNASEQEIEKEIQAKGLTAPRITPDQIDATIVAQEYRVFDGVLTVCVLTLVNGFKVTGESACASPENYDELIGRRIARENARNKIWALEGYRLRSKLAAPSAALKIEGDNVIFSSGRRDYANCGIIGLGPDGSISGGYDGGFPSHGRDLTKAEQIELAEYMIQQWKLVLSSAA